MNRVIYSVLLFVCTLVAQPPLPFDAHYVPAIMGDESTSLYFRAPRFFTFDSRRIQVVKSHNVDSYVRRVQSGEDLHKSLEYGYYCVRYTHDGKPYITYRPFLLGGARTPFGHAAEKVVFYVLNFGLGYLAEETERAVAEYMGIDPAYVHPLMMMLYKGGSVVGGNVDKIARSSRVTRTMRNLRKAATGIFTLPKGALPMSPEEVLLMSLLPGGDTPSDKTKRLFFYLRGIYHNDPEMVAHLIGAPTPDLIPDTFTEFILQVREASQTKPLVLNTLNTIVEHQDPSITKFMKQTVLQAPQRARELLLPLENKVKDIFRGPLDVMSNFVRTGSPYATPESLPPLPSQKRASAPRGSVSLQRDTEIIDRLRECEELQKALQRVPKTLSDTNASALLFDGDTVPEIVSVDITQDGINEVRHEIPLAGTASGDGSVYHARKRPWSWKGTPADDGGIRYRPLTEEEQRAMRARLPRNHDYLGVLKDASEIKERPEPEELKKTIEKRRRVRNHSKEKYVKHKSTKAPTPPVPPPPPKKHNAAASLHSADLSGTNPHGNLQITLGGPQQTNYGYPVDPYGNTRVDLGENKVLYVAEYRPELDKSGEYLELYNRLVAQAIEDDIVTANKSFLTAVNLAGMTNIFVNNKIHPEKLEKISSDYWYLRTVCDVSQELLNNEIEYREDIALQSSVGPKAEKLICTALENDTEIPVSVHGIMETMNQNYTALENCETAKSYMNRFSELVEIYKDNPVVLKALRATVAAAIVTVVEKQKWELNVSNAFKIVAVGAVVAAGKKYMPLAVARAGSWLAGAAVDKFCGFWF